MERHLFVEGHRERVALPDAACLPSPELAPVITAMFFILIIMPFSQLEYFSYGFSHYYIKTYAERKDCILVGKNYQLPLTKRAVICIMIFM